MECMSTDSPRIGKEATVRVHREILVPSGVRTAIGDFKRGLKDFSPTDFVARALDFGPAKTNTDGGAVALGHPIGATGAILVVKAIHELRRAGARYALAAICTGGGQGIAAIFERA
jgi:Thiolase, C-terminal domain